MINIRWIAWRIDLAILLSNSSICLGLIKRGASISRTCQTVFANSLLTKRYLVAQVLINVIAIISFPNIYSIVEKLLQKRSFDLKNEEIIRLLSSSLEETTFFFNQHLQYHLYLKYLWLQKPWLFLDNYALYTFFLRSNNIFFLSWAVISLHPNSELSRL